ncbi:hypothetical protein CLI64_29865 (plasmid) [Nostoc sp. CENA543]|uniref:hypothetical protein n=1 Tax=Nostoc sp. CENA543 TaxID=1869241 RepID=UPI000CA21C30|nr:hypothetical protein [Nostoc sp. CENA543]AUT04644.1 hypothetical protein CLI64_29865 [Nostoc sp. CENA543]
MKRTEIAAGVIALLALVSIGYYGTHKYGANRMIQIGVGLGAIGAGMAIFQSLTNRSPVNPPSISKQQKPVGAVNPKK